MVAVIASTGKKLMPTSEYRARKLLKKGRAEIYSYHPFAIQMTDREDGETQEIEYKSDTGYLHVGVSICSGRHEYVSREFTLAGDEVENRAQRRKYRRARRNRKRYRKPRFQNRTSAKKKGWIAPSLKHRMERQIDLFRKHYAVYPITSATLEMGKIDIQALSAEEAGQEKPQGTAYQQGPRYQSANLRSAVFARDGYKCRICGRSAFDGDDKAYLHEHHIGFWKGDRTNRLGNLMTVCEKCHTTANHQKNGKLYGLEPGSDNYADATYMNVVRFQMLSELKKNYPGVTFHIQYGTRTACTRRERDVQKSHANDAYCIGRLHPAHRTPTQYYKKNVRNNRVLEKFYDAVYEDTRNGKQVKAKNLGCGRTKRNTHLEYEDLTVFRGKKVSSGHRNIRRRKPSLLPGTIVRVKNGGLEETATVHGTHTQYRRDKKTGKREISGCNVEFQALLSNGRKSIAIRFVEPLHPKYRQAWSRIKK